MVKSGIWLQVFSFSDRFPGEDPVLLTLLGHVVPFNVIKYTYNLLSVDNLDVRNKRTTTNNSHRRLVNWAQEEAEVIDGLQTECKL